MKVVDFIVAEDVRTELGNKHSVMGVFGDSITLTVPAEQRWPIGFRLASFIRLEFTARDPAAFRFEFKIYWGEQDVAGFEGAGTKGADTAIVTLPLVAMVPLGGPGDFRFRLRILDGDGKELLVEHLRTTRVVVHTASP